VLGVAWVCFVTQIHVNLTAPRQEGVPGESFLCPYISKQCVPIRFEIATLLSMTYTLYVCVCVCDVLHILPTYQGKKVYQVSPSFALTFQSSVCRLGLKLQPYFPQHLLCMCVCVFVCVCDVLHILPTYQGKKVYQVSPSLPCSGGASGASSWPLATTKRSVGRVCAHCVINVCWIGLGT
jgi:hypothetical protein